MHRNKVVGLSITAAVIGGLAVVGAVMPNPDAKSTTNTVKAAASTKTDVAGAVDVDAMLAAANKAGAKAKASDAATTRAADPYNGFSCGKIKNGARVLCADGWAVGVKLEKNYFGFAEGKGTAVRVFGDDTTAWVNVTLTRGSVDVAQMSGIVSNYSGNPQVINLTGADTIDSGTYTLTMNVTSY